MTGTVLVTGATGFIGDRVVARLLAEGRRVRVLARSPGRLRRTVRRRVEVVVGAIEDPEAVRRSVEEVDLVLHLAGLAAAWSPRRSDFHTVNVDGVRRLLEAARSEDVARIVHVSTVLTLFPRIAALTAYGASKMEGERLVRAYIGGGRDAVLVHPCRVYGPGPLTDANGVTKLIQAYLRGPIPVRLRDGDVRGNYVHVDDVAEGILLAAFQGRRGGAYVLGGENRSVRELLALAGELAGARHREVALPPALGLAAAGAFELFGRLGAPVPITRGWVRTYLHDHAVDIGPTSAALGYRPRSLRRGLAQTIGWLGNGGAR